MQTYDVVLNEKTGQPIDIATGARVVPRFVNGDVCTVRLWFASVDDYSRITYQQQIGATVALSAKYYDGTELIPATALAEVKAGSEYFHSGTVDFGTANIDTLFDADDGVVEIHATVKITVTKAENIRSYNWTAIIEEP